MGLDLSVSLPRRMADSVQVTSSTVAFLPTRLSASTTSCSWHAWTARPPAGPAALRANLPLRTIPARPMIACGTLTNLHHRLLRARVPSACNSRSSNLIRQCSETSHVAAVPEQRSAGPTGRPCRAVLYCAGLHARAQFDIVAGAQR